MWWRETFSYILQLRRRDEIGATSSPVKIGASSMTNGTVTQVHPLEKIRRPHSHGQHR